MRFVIVRLGLVPHVPIAMCAVVQGFDKDQLSVERYLNLRYDGTDVAVMTLCPEGDDFAKVCFPTDRL